MKILKWLPLLFISALLIHSSSFASHGNRKSKRQNLPNRIKYILVYDSQKGDFDCQDQNGTSGFNYNRFAPCTDFTEVNLSSSASKKRLEKQRLNLAGSKASHRRIMNTHFFESDLSFIDLRSSQVQATFEKVSLIGADLRGTDLSGSVFIGNSNQNGKSYKRRYQLEGAIFDDSTDLLTLLDADENYKYKSEKEFAFEKNMIRMVTPDEPEVDLEIEGGILSQIKWNEKTEKGIMTLHLFVKNMRISIPNKKTYNELLQFQLNQKIKVGLMGNTLVYSEPLNLEKSQVSKIKLRRNHHRKSKAIE